GAAGVRRPLGTAGSGAPSGRRRLLRRLGARRTRTARRADGPAATAGPQDHLGEPARGEGRLRAGAGRNSGRAAVLGWTVGGTQPRSAGGTAEGDAGCVT